MPFINEKNCKSAIIYNDNCKCSFSYLAPYRDVIISPFNTVTNVNYAENINLSPNKFYLIGGEVFSANLPQNVKDGDIIIIADGWNRWSTYPFNIFGFSHECYGLELNRNGGVFLFVFNGHKKEWTLQAWSRKYLTPSQSLRGEVKKIEYQEGLPGIEYYIRIIGEGYSTFTDIDNLYSERLYQVFVYPERGEIVLDLKDKFLAPIINIEFVPEPIEDFSYYKIIINNEEFLEGELIRQRLLFNNSYIFDLEDGDIMLRTIEYILINSSTKSRDSIVLDDFNVRNVKVRNYNSNLRYIENQDYILKSATGEIIPTINGRIRANDPILITYEVETS